MRTTGIESGQIIILKKIDYFFQATLVSKIVEAPCGSGE
jgi:hypothetical protein